MKRNKVTGLIILALCVAFATQVVAQEAKSSFL